MKKVIFIFATICHGNSVKLAADSYLTDADNFVNYFYRYSLLEQGE